MFNNKVLLITGNTQSLKNTVLRRFIHTSIKKILIFCRDKKKQLDKKSQCRCDKIKFYIGDVCDEYFVHFAMCGVDYVFHSTPLKQVSCEYFPNQALKRSVLRIVNLMNFVDIKAIIELSSLQPYVSNEVFGETTYQSIF